MRAQLALIGQLNTLRNIDKQFLSLYRNESGREFKMVMFYQASSNLTLDFNSLAFLLLRYDANLIGEIHIAERSFQTSIESLRMRNEATERLHSRGDLKHMDIQSGRCTIAVDPRDMKLLKDVTDSLYDSIDDAITKCDAAIKDLKKAGKVLFPKRPFLSVEDEKKNRG